MAESWRVTTTEPGPLNGPQLLALVLNCHTLFRALTRAQRAALLAAVEGQVSGHSRVLGALEAHGLVEGGRLTEAGEEIRRWNLPSAERTMPG